MLQVASDFQAIVAVLASCEWVAFKQVIQHLGWDLFCLVELWVFWLVSFGVFVQKTCKIEGFLPGSGRQLFFNCLNGNKVLRLDSQHPQGWWSSWVARGLHHSAGKLVGG